MRSKKLSSDRSSTCTMLLRSPCDFNRRQVAGARTIGCKRPLRNTLLYIHVQSRRLGAAATKLSSRNSTAGSETSFTASSQWRQRFSRKVATPCPIPLPHPDSLPRRDPSSFPSRFRLSGIIPAKKSASVKCLSSSFMTSSIEGRLALLQNGNPVPRSSKEKVTKNLLHSGVSTFV